MALDQPLTLQHVNAEVTLSGLKQLLEDLPPEKVRQLQNDLQAVLDTYTAEYIGNFPSLQLLPTA